MAVALNFYRDQHDRDHAAVSWLRAAYLIVFAKLGYRFILGRAYHAVREKIAEPKSEAIEVFKITDPQRLPSARTIAIVREPEDLRGIALQMGRHIVFLPGPNDTGLYDRLKRDKEGTRAATRITLHGWEVPWPREPELYFDFLGPTRS